MQTLRCVATRLKRERLDLGTEYLGLLEITVSHFEAANGPVELRQLDAEHVRRMMRRLMDAGRAVETVNGYRRRLFYVWRQAREWDRSTPPVPASDVCRLKTIYRRPTAWHQDELAALLAGCESVPPSKGWGPQQDRALIMVIYDTSLRLGALLKAKVTQLDMRRCALFIPGDQQKGRGDTCQPLHPDTCIALAKLPREPGDERLIPLTICRRNLSIRMGKILKAAGLPCTRRDKYHKLRRTSYTMVAKEFGVEAASQHAAHRTDMSRYYLDPTFLDKPNPLDALPRPQAG